MGVVVMVSGLPVGACFASISPLPPFLLEPLQTAGPLGSPDVTPVHRYFGPSRVPLAVHRFPGVSGYTVSLLRRFRDRTSGFLQLLSAPLSSCCPYYPAEASRPVSQLRRSMLSSPVWGEFDLRIFRFRGHLWVHLRYGPMTCSPSLRWLRR